MHHVTVHAQAIRIPEHQLTFWPRLHPARDLPQTEIANSRKLIKKGPVLVACKGNAHTVQEEYWTKNCHETKSEKTVKRVSTFQVMYHTYPYVKNKEQWE